MPSIRWQQRIKGAVKTEIFSRLVIFGTIYVTCEGRDGRWIVVSNSHLWPGGAF